MSPPIVPAASGNQKLSLPVPAIKGTNPNIVLTTVVITGIIFTLKASRYISTSTPVEEGVAVPVSDALSWVCLRILSNSLMI